MRNVPTDIHNACNYGHGIKMPAYASVPAYEGDDLV